MSLLNTAKSIGANPKLSDIPGWVAQAVYSAARVEGYRTSYEMCDALLDGKLLGIQDKAELTFLLNMIRAYVFICDHKADVVDIAYLCELNRLAGRDLFEDCGKLRQKDVFVGSLGIVPPIPEHPVVVRDLMLLNEKANVVDKALAYFCYACKKQLFIDGNKRVAQLIANKILLEGRAGVIICIPPDMIITFNGLLQDYYLTNDSYDIKQWLKAYAFYRI